MQVLGAVAEFERDLLIERTQQGLQRAKAEGKKLGRPTATSTTASVQRLKSIGISRVQTAAELKVGIATVKRHWNKADMDNYVLVGEVLPSYFEPKGAF